METENCSMKRNEEEKKRKKKTAERRVKTAKKKRGKFDWQSSRYRRNEDFPSGGRRQLRTAHLNVIRRCSIEPNRTESSRVEPNRAEQEITS